MDFSRLPKIELHLHLDCSISFEAAREMDPSISRAEFRDRLVAPPKCAGLTDYLTRAVEAIRMLQTSRALRIATLDLFRQLADDHVIYAEMRFAPLEHLTGGLSAEAVVQTVLEAVEEGSRQTGISAGLILCDLRHYTPEQSMALARLATKFNGTAVVGIDLASDEACPIENHLPAFQWARRHGLACTAHAGEARGAESVWETLRLLAPQRIGHGVRSAEDTTLICHLLEQDLHLEICPTSNIQTDVYARYADHPVDSLFRGGLSVSINTDARTISQINLNQEYQKLHEHFDWPADHFLKCNLEAVRHAFAPDERKEQLRARLLKAYGQTIQGSAF